MNAKGSRETPVPVIVESWRAGDSIALATRDEFLDNFGKALSVLVNIIDPDAFVLGGGLSNTEEIYEMGPSQVEKYVFNDEFRTPILKNVFGDSSAFEARRRCGRSRSCRKRRLLEK